MKGPLDKLRKLNPDLPLYSVLDPAFAPYGRVLDVEGGEELLAALATTPMPEQANHYFASWPALEATDAAKAFPKTVFGLMKTQAGFCNGYGHTLNAMEYHKCSEVNATTTGLVLLLARAEDLKDGVLSSADVVGFYLPANVFVEIHPRVLHFAPCAIRKTGFNCLVVLEKGTNSPLPKRRKTAAGEEKLLLMKNKWLVCHPDSPQAAKGFPIGITGTNIVLRY